MNDRLEHALAHRAATAAEVDDACAWAVEAGLAAVAVRPAAAAHALAATGGSGVRVVVVLGDPGDAGPAVDAGAGHVALTLERDRLLAGEAAVAAELAALARLVHASGVHLRAVLPAGLPGERLAAAGRLAIEVGADELQAGTAAGGAATPAQLAELRDALPARHARRPVVAACPAEPGAVRALLAGGADLVAVPDPAPVLGGRARGGGGDGRLSR